MDISKVQEKNSFCQSTCPDLGFGHVVLGDEGSLCPALGRRWSLILDDPYGDRVVPQRAQKHLF